MYEMVRKKKVKFNMTTVNLWFFDNLKINVKQFGWYEWVYFTKDSASFRFQKEQLGRCLGPAKMRAMKWPSGC